MFPLPLQRLIETASWGEDPAAIKQQLVSHQRFHNSIQRSGEVDRAREELVTASASVLFDLGQLESHPV